MREDYPVFLYAAGRYRFLFLLCLCLGGLEAAYGLSRGDWLIASIGGIFAGCSALFWLAVRDKIKAGPALTREGNMLMGGELPRPIPVEGSRFQIRDDYEGGWIVLLWAGESEFRLSPGGWTLEEEFSGTGKSLGARWPTRKMVREALLQLGLEENVPEKI